MSGFYKNIGWSAQPRSKYELQEEMKKRIQRGQYNLNDIDTSKITDMSYLFFCCDYVKDIDKIDISFWDTSRVTSMEFMFSCCYKFNSDISRWDVSNVQNMQGMFESCRHFNGDLSKWNVNNVQNMSCMFMNCTSFNSDISNWDVSNVQNMQSMFYNCENFEQDLSRWNIKGSTAFPFSVFKGCFKLDEKIPDSWWRYFIKDYDIITSKE